jgi:hypothetical protein
MMIFYFKLEHLKKKKKKKKKSKKNKKKKKKKKKKKGTSRIKPVGIFQRPKKAGAQCFSCTTRTYKSYIHHHI